MKLIYLVFVALIISHSAFAKAAPKVKEKEEPQTASAPAVPPVEKTDFSKGQVGLELLGNGILYSVNGSYRPLRNLALNAGIGGFSVGNASLTIVPLSVSGLMGEQNHNFEVSGGIVFGSVSGTIVGDDSRDKITRNSTIGQVGIGYRYWPVEGGFHFRAMLFGLFGGGTFLPWPGFNFGYAF